ncbi:hypothetical protein [Bradyrhizobium sp. 1]|uniref:hypothetical protein n=1 Tax=Bradyrhizobium sp. 1 TaxID=241591 RepID=UPI001FF83A8C|nr:hypothetical protein [Bradyrhizobium sp. 1]MCK1393645.1 hypothetical protein [Bradyrhizobium sp. 1]
MSEQHPDIEAPPLMPTGEIAANENSEFNARFLAFVVPFLEKSNWEFQQGLVTRSAKWGLIWRGDYAIADLAARLINRIMCWEGADGKLLIEIAVGQRIAPLQVALHDDPADGQG